MAIFDKVALTSFLVLNLIELVCYSFVISELHKHHKKHVALCLANRPERATMKVRSLLLLCYRNWCRCNQ